MLVFPDPLEIAGDRVKIIISSPAGRTIRDVELFTADLSLAQARTAKSGARTCRMAEI